MGCPEAKRVSGPVMEFFHDVFQFFSHKNVEQPGLGRIGNKLGVFVEPLLPGSVGAGEVDIGLERFRRFFFQRNLLLGHVKATLQLFQKFFPRDAKVFFDDFGQKAGAYFLARVMGYDGGSAIGMLIYHVASHRVVVDKPEFLNYFC